MKGVKYGCGCLAAVVVMLVAMPVMLFGGSGASAGGGGGLGTVVPVATSVPQQTDLVPLFSWTPASGEPIVIGYPWGQCTWFVSYQGHAGGNHRVTWRGDAWTWMVSAFFAGIPTAPPSAVPGVGWIAVFAPGHGSGAAGHVAVVVAVTATSYTVEEMNVLGLGVVDVRMIAMGASAPLLEGWIP